MFAGTVAGRFRSLGSFGNIQFVSYTVQSGDTLSGIADQFGVDMNTIAAQNMISDPNQISVGQQLDIPMEDAQFNAYYNQIASSPAEFTPAQIAAAGSTAMVPQASSNPAIIPTPKSLQATQSNVVVNPQTAPAVQNPLVGFFQGATFGINNVLFYGSIAAVVIFIVIPYLRKPAPKYAKNEPVHDNPVSEGDGHGDDL